MTRTILTLMVLAAVAGAEVFDSGSSTLHGAPDEGDATITTTTDTEGSTATIETVEEGQPSTCVPPALEGEDADYDPPSGWYWGNSLVRIDGDWWVWRMRRVGPFWEVQLLCLPGANQQGATFGGHYGE